MMNISWNNLLFSNSQKHVSHAVFCALVMAVFWMANVTSADVILHYSANGNVLDSSGNGHDGALFNGATYGTGVAGQAFSFDGINDFLEGPVVPQINPNAFSAAFWVNAAPVNGLQLVFDSSHGGTRNGSINWEGFAFQFFSNNHIDFAFGNGTAFPHVLSTSVVADNSFHHVAATFDGSLMSLYIDGVLDNTAAFSGTPNISGRPIRLGNHDQLTNRALNGLVDDVRLYNEVLSASQVQALANIPEPGSLALLAPAAIVMFMRRKRR